MVLRRGGLGPAPRIGPTWTQFLRSQAYGLSPGARSEEDEALEELVPVPQWERPAPLSEDRDVTENDEQSMPPRAYQTDCSSRRWALSRIPQRRFPTALELALETDPRWPRESGF